MIDLWMGALDFDVQNQIIARLLQWAPLDRWLESYSTAVEPDRAGARVEPFLKLRVIELLHRGSVYRIFGTDVSAREFVMLYGDIDPERRAKPHPSAIQNAKDRLDVLRMHPQRRRPYEI